MGVCVCNQHVSSVVSCVIVELRGVCVCVCVCACV